ncbi:hypothetical protein D1AOALGA4SA_8770 [Olavius algarvensis Delta 1 endosymbiont]|nr:hypothetical protein D1AOALGA4SA_8770 [Olavius algarvensis Delta 1 endosymbiont]
MILSTKCFTKYQTRNTKHMMNSSIYEFINFQYSIHRNTTASHKLRRLREFNR